MLRADMALFMVSKHRYEGVFEGACEVQQAAQSWQGGS